MSTQTFIAKGTGQKVVFGPHGAFATEGKCREVRLQELSAQIQTAVEQAQQKASEEGGEADVSHIESQQSEAYQKLEKFTDVFLPVSVFMNDGVLDAKAADVQHTKGAMVLFSDPRVQSRVKPYPDIDEVPGFALASAQALVATDDSKIRQSLGFHDEDAAEAVDMTEHVYRPGADEWGDDDIERAQNLTDSIEEHNPSVQAIAVLNWLKLRNIPPKIYNRIEKALKKAVAQSES